ncbi:MAG: heme ABC exporter ATP-binding protein CcmA [Proteobacteria bacterium]|nr:heme ABC exporter ATP-binding protein CcmA [Pseudomonadota bacterium]
MGEAEPRFEGAALGCVRGERRVFEGVSFRVRAGGALLLTGPNGSGKSSLLRLMAGLLKPAEGSLGWNGAPIADDWRAHGLRVHYVGHHDALKPILTTQENLAFWTALAIGQNPASRAVEDRVAAALEGLGVLHLRHLPARLLSAGQQRRVALARTLAWFAPLWLLDEPTTALDREGVALVIGAIERHRGAGGIVVLSTHADLDLAGAEGLELGRRRVAPDAMTEALS